MYIRGAACISPQQSFDALVAQPSPITGNRMYCIEPDYTKLIDAKMIRRMSRIIKMGVAAAMECLNQCGEKTPGAIITGTAYGCLADTELFLNKMVDNRETLLTPTAFIQSTHNTVGAQIALLLKCHNYNNTFVHRGFSFESALLDAITLLAEGQLSTALVGGVDEITDTSHTILSRFGLYKKQPFSADGFFQQGTKGTVAGEGAAFFLLADQPSGNDYAQLKAMSTFYKPVSPADITHHIKSFLAQQEVDMDTIDLVMTGENGDLENDAVYTTLFQTIFQGKQHMPFKNLGGEYPTATAFALWLAAHILKTGTLPSYADAGKPPSSILIYNHYQHIHHSLYLLSAC